MAVPAELMALLGGGGAPEGAPQPPPQDAGAPMGGPTGAPQPPGPSDGSHGGAADLLEQAIAMLDQAVAAEADQEDQQVIRKCLTALQGILANDQKTTDSMMGGQMDTRGMRKMADAGPQY